MSRDKTFTSASLTHLHRGLPGPRNVLWTHIRGHERSGRNQLIRHVMLWLRERHVDCRRRRHAGLDAFGARRLVGFQVRDDRAVV